MSRNVLLILASGKSSRFGGYPKAFCKLDKETVAQNTVNYAYKKYDKIYMAVNKEIYPHYKDIVVECTVFDIITGQGDAHSLLKALRHIASCEPCIDTITVCWGDAVFINDCIFQKARELSDILDGNMLGITICALDYEPYAWFDIMDRDIVCSHFAAQEGMVHKGIHDQSVFVFRMPLIIEYLEKYKESMDISDDIESISDTGIEMKLLNSFTFFYKNGMLPMKYCLVDSGMVFSFNTTEELEKIKELVIR